MRDPSDVLRGELRHGAVLACAVLAVLGIIAAWSVLIPGVADWENLAVAVVGSLRLTGPVAMAFAAWAAVRRRRVATDERPGPAMALATPAALVLVAVAAYSASAAALSLKTVIADEAGEPAVSGLLMGAAGLALHVIVGWVAGWLAPSALTPLVVGLGAYLFVGWAGGARSWWGLLTPATREPYDLFTQPSPALFVDQTMWLAGLGAALLLGWAFAVSRRRVLLAPVALAILAAGGGAARLHEQGGTAMRGSKEIASTCREWPLTVCVHPAMRGALPKLTEEFTGLASRLKGTPGEFIRVEQGPRTLADAPTDGVATIHVDDLASGYAEEAADEYVEGLDRSCDQPHHELVESWLLGDPLPRDPQAASTWFTRLDEYARRGWLRANYGKFTTCRLESMDFSDAALPRTFAWDGSAAPGGIHGVLYGSPAARRPALRSGCDHQQTITAPSTGEERPLGGIAPFKAKEAP